MNKQIQAKFPHIKIAEIDISENENSKIRFIIDEYPFFILFVREIPIEYHDEITAENLMTFISEKTVISRYPAESEEDIYNALYDSSKGTAIFYGDEDSEECDDFYLVQLPYSDLEYMNFDDEEIAEKYGFNETHRVAIFYDGKKKFYSGELNFFEIGEFVELNMFKEVVRFTYSSLDHLMDRNRFNGSLILFLSSEELIPEAEANLKELIKAFTKINYSFSYFVASDNVQAFMGNFYAKINDLPIQSNVIINLKNRLSLFNTVIHSLERQL